MNTKYITIMTVALLLTAACVETCTAQSGMSVGAKYHANHAVFTDLPYDEGDMSVGFSIDSVTAESLVQLAVEYAWDVNGETPNGKGTTDFILTPQINMIWKDGAWFGGFGVMMSYIEDEIAGDDWSDLYYQIILGLKIPFLGSAIDVGAHYELENWDDLSDFDIDDLAYGAWLTISM